MRDVSLRSKTQYSASTCNVQSAHKAPNREVNTTQKKNYNRKATPPERQGCSTTANHCWATKFRTPHFHRRRPKSCARPDRETHARTSHRRQALTPARRMQILQMLSPAQAQARKTSTWAAAGRLKPQATMAAWATTIIGGVNLRPGDRRTRTMPCNRHGRWARECRTSQRTTNYIN